jgi:3-deoxy-D-manno-octulosonic-acid transferase
VRRVLRQIDVIAAQDETTAERFVQLGCRAESVVLTGSLKFDGAICDRENPRTIALREAASIAPGELVFLAGSTQAPEEAYALEVYRQLVPQHPGLRLLIAPRHPDRFEEVARLLEESGLPYQRRTELQDSELRNPQSAILLIDTIGELSAWWGAATVGFVGGSFGSRGGQNMLEPAAYGVATCFGPLTRNFRDIVSRLLAADAACVVHDEAELLDFVRRSLDDPAWAEGLSQRARQLVASQQGATRRTVELLLPLLGKGSRRSRAA